MTRDATNPPALPAWLVDWMRDASCHGQSHSLALGSTGAEAQVREVAGAVADYLNEFDTDGGCQWRAFDPELLRNLARDPASRDLVLAGAAPLPPRVPFRSDLDRVVRRLARLGGVVLVGSDGLEATADLDETFRICLCAGEPADCRRFHMWVNFRRFSFPSLVNVIADSFLNWSWQGDLHPARSNPSAPAAPGRISETDLPD